MPGHTGTAVPGEEEKAGRSRTQAGGQETQPTGERQSPLIQGFGSIQVQPRACLMPPPQAGHTCNAIGILQHGALGAPPQRYKPPIFR